MGETSGTSSGVARGWQDAFLGDKDRTSKLCNDGMSFCTPLRTKAAPLSSPMFRNSKTYVTVRKKRRVSDYRVKTFPQQPTTLSTPLKYFERDKEIEDLIDSVKAGSELSPNQKDASFNPSKRRRLSMPVQSLSLSNFDPVNLFSDLPENEDIVTKKPNPRRQSLKLSQKHIKKRNLIQPMSLKQKDNEKKSRIPVFQPNYVSAFSKTTKINDRINYKQNFKIKITKTMPNNKTVMNTLPSLFTQKPTKNKTAKTSEYRINADGSDINLVEKSFSEICNVEYSPKSSTPDSFPETSPISTNVKLNGDCNELLPDMKMECLSYKASVKDSFVLGNSNHSVDRLITSPILHSKSNCAGHKWQFTNHEELAFKNESENMQKTENDKNVISIEPVRIPTTFNKCNFFPSKHDLRCLIAFERKLSIETSRSPEEDSIETVTESECNTDDKIGLISSHFTLNEDEVVSAPTSNSETEQQHETGRRTRSRTKIRKNLPKLQVRHTPMGLPKPIREKKEKFSLEEIYLNKNFRTPTEKKWETIFEFPKENKDGTLSNCEKRKKKRICEFTTDPSQRKKKWKIKKIKPGKRKRSASDVEIDKILSQKLFNLDNALKLADLSP